MQTKFNILHVCSTWRTAALNTPRLWCDLDYIDISATLPLEFYHAWLRRAASVPLNLKIFPAGSWGGNKYWSQATEILHTHCRALGTLHLGLPNEDAGCSPPPLFPPPHRPTNLRNLIIESYDDCIHNNLVNIPWNQLSRLEFRVEYDMRFISASQRAGILSQTVNLTHLVADLGPDTRFSPSSIRLLYLPQLQTSKVSWTDHEDCFPRIIPHSFIDLFDKLFIPALRFLTIKTSRGADALVLPAFTSLAARCQFALESLHIRILHWDANGAGFPGLVEALTCTAEAGLLPNLVDISVGVNSYDGLLPAFADMVTSRRASSNVAIHDFALNAHTFIENFAENVDVWDTITPSLNSSSKAANEYALSRLEKPINAASNTGLRGSVEFEHFDQRLAFGADVETVVLQVAQVDHDNPQADDDNLSYWDKASAWGCMDPHSRQQWF
ncbi:F-box domain-containing protein [Mycena sanguinolenta]|uniref:F-box domain-containing protein n=1 Tax=Mycena sanguinolenta TaxID=230812 RepID=A0A8H6X6Y8_9AGAR|nr:F-box domain-containing protein [Mycena sanguinolenta]